MQFRAEQSVVLPRQVMLRVGGQHCVCRGKRVRVLADGQLRPPPAFGSAVHHFCFGRHIKHDE